MAARQEDPGQRGAAKAEPTRKSWRLIAKRGLTPAAAAELLKIDQRRNHSRHSWLQTCTVPADVAADDSEYSCQNGAARAAIAVIVLTDGSALLAEVVRLKVSGLSYDLRDVYVLTVSLRHDRGVEVDQRRQQLLARVRAEPHVQAAWLVDVPPTGGVSPAPPMLIGQHQLSRREATAGFLPAIGARFRSGRDFTDDDVSTNEGVVTSANVAITGNKPLVAIKVSSYVSIRPRRLFCRNLRESTTAAYS